MRETPAAAPHVAMHFDDAGQQSHAMQLGMWAFLATEVLFFGAVLFAYSEYRRQHPLEFAEGSHHMNVWLGTFNTLVLLTSSLTVALAVRSVQLNQSRLAAWLLIATLALGLVFLGVKVYEYAEKWQEGHVPGAHFHWEHVENPDVKADYVELFFSLYFVMTGLHALHMIIGMGVLIVLAIFTWRGRYGSGLYWPIENFGLYWHFVDIVWVYLFPLLYLIR